MAAMLKAGQFQSLPFQDAWLASERIKNRHGGMPPLPDSYEADDMELAETANMEGRR